MYQGVLDFKKMTEIQIKVAKVNISRDGLENLEDNLLTQKTEISDLRTSRYFSSIVLLPSSPCLALLYFSATVLCVFLFSFIQQNLEEIWKLYF
jgi:hypothetical protein